MSLQQLQIVTWLCLVGFPILLPATGPCELRVEVDRSLEEDDHAVCPRHVSSAVFRAAPRCTLRSCVHSAPASTPKEHHGPECSPNDLGALLGAIERIIDFYEASVDGIAAVDRKDGVVGLLILQGQLVSLPASSLSPPLRQLLGRVQAVTPKIFESSLKDVTPAEEFRLRAVFNPILYAARPSHSLMRPGPDPSEIGNEEDVFDIELNFECLSDLALNCSVSSKCEEAFQRQPGSQYMLTHQVAFLNFAWHRNCHVVVNEELLDKLCAKTYAESEYLANSGFPVRFRDLFSEQVMLCGLAGFGDFARADWLREIMAWQSRGPVACYPNPRGGYCGDSVVKVRYRGCAGADAAEGGVGVEECLVHMTAVSLGAMAVNLKYMIDHCL